MADNSSLMHQTSLSVSLSLSQDVPAGSEIVLVLQYNPVGECIASYLASFLFLDTVERNKLEPRTHKYG